MGSFFGTVLGLMEMGFAAVEVGFVGLVTGFVVLAAAVVLVAVAVLVVPAVVKRPRRRRHTEEEDICVGGLLSIKLGF